MHAQVTPLDGTKAIGITFTDKPVTAFGGLALFVVFAQLAILHPAVAPHGGRARSSLPSKACSRPPLRDCQRITFTQVSF